jgi:hypothetical protein
MRRFDHMFKLGFDLSDLAEKSSEVTRSMDAQIDELVKKVPQLKVREYLEELAEGFTEMTFMPLDDVWETGLRDLFDDVEDQD